MKKLVLVLAAVLVFGGVLYAGDAPVPLCPKTKMRTDCLSCHVVADFRVRETPFDAVLVYPFNGMKIVVEDGIPKGYYLLQGIDSDQVKQYFEYLNGHDIKHAIIEIHSLGGGLFDAQRIVSLIQYWQSKGFKIETRLFGTAFSAGFYIFVAGDVRLISEYCDLMWHEIQSFEGFGYTISTPSDKEEAARVLRHLQDVRHRYLATRGKLTKEEIDRMVSKKEWWMSGPEAVKFGFADGLITKK